MFGRWLLRLLLLLLLLIGRLLLLLLKLNGGLSRSNIFKVGSSRGACILRHTSGTTRRL